MIGSVVFKSGILKFTITVFPISNSDSPNIIEETEFDSYKILHLGFVPNKFLWVEVGQMDEFNTELFVCRTQRKARAKGSRDGSQKRRRRIRPAVPSQRRSLRKQPRPTPNRPVRPNISSTKGPNNKQNHLFWRLLLRVTIIFVPLLPAFTVSAISEFAFFLFYSINPRHKVSEFWP